MYINNSELCDLEVLIGMLDSALERNPKDFVEGYNTVEDTINRAETLSNKIRNREVNKLANKLVKKRLSK